MSVKINIVTCPLWKARAPVEEPTLCGKAIRIIDHHTAGHGSTPEKYAQAIQRQHIGQGWIDSGHNFLVMRDGTILQGRWLTVSAIQKGLMVISAHCPGQNSQIGIEHEHQGTEQFTAAQIESSARLRAWIADRYGRVKVLPSAPHSRYFATACPVVGVDVFARINRRAQQILDAERDR